MIEPIVVGLDIGTTKICTLVARIEDENNLRILGVGIEPSQGIRKGTIVDMSAASQCIARSVEKAQRSAGMEVKSAFVSLAGSHVSSVNSRGVVGISGGIIEQDDVDRALDAAQAVAIPHNREIIHVVQRGFIVDGQEAIRTPVGMHGYRLEVEAHIITAAAATVENLRQCVMAAGLETDQFVLNPLASAEVVLTETERNMGVIVCDIGGGTTDLAIYVDGDVWHTMVLAVGGNHFTNDIAHGLRLSPETAEEVKKHHGHAVESEISESDLFTVQSFGEDKPVQVSRRELADIIEARVEEIFQLVLQEIKRSGYDGLVASRDGPDWWNEQSARAFALWLPACLKSPVRVAKPENLVGLVDQLHSPAYSTSVGLLNWAVMMNDSITPVPRKPHYAEEGRRRPCGVVKKLLQKPDAVIYGHPMTNRLSNLRSQTKEDTMEQNTQSLPESFARIKVVGVGGGGCNAVNRMIDEGHLGHRVYYRQYRCPGTAVSPKPRPASALVIRSPAASVLAATLRSGGKLPKNPPKNCTKFSKAPTWSSLPLAWVAVPAPVQPPSWPRSPRKLAH